MRAGKIQRIGAVLKGWGKPFGFGCLTISFLLASGAGLAQPGQNRISASEQASRDDERLRILRDELRKSEALVESLARRKAERLAAADVPGADEADERRVRALSDITGLKREIGAARAGVEVKVGSGQVPTPAKATAAKPAPTAPWWDVYGKARGGNTPASVSYAQPSSDDGARDVPNRRLE